MSDKRDREVRKLFSIANSVAMDHLNDENLKDLTPHEIFIGSCKMAAEATAEEIPLVYSGTKLLMTGKVDKHNVAFSMLDDEAVVVAGGEHFEEVLWGVDWGDNDYED